MEGAEGKVARALIGDDADSIAKAAMKIDDVKEAIIKQILRILNEECARLCKLKDNTQSQFRKIPVSQLHQFKWKDMIAELQSTAPLFYRMMYSLASRNDYRNLVKVGTVHFPGICSAVAILLKERNREMCGLQSMISLLMYSCHCEKQVSKSLKTYCA